MVMLKCYCTTEEIEEQKKELNKKKYPMFMIENGVMLVKIRLQKDINQL